MQNIEALKKQYEELMDKKITETAKELQVCEVSLPTIEEYAKKNTTINKRLQTKLEENKIYCSFYKSMSYATNKEYIMRLTLTHKETRNQAELYTAGDNDEQKTKTLPDELKKKIDYLKEHIDELKECKKQAPSVIKAISQIETIKTQLTYKIGKPATYDKDKKELPYSITGFISDNLPRW